MLSLFSASFLAYLKYCRQLPFCVAVFCLGSGMASCGSYFNYYNNNNVSLPSESSFLMKYWTTCPSALLTPSTCLLLRTEYNSSAQRRTCTCRQCSNTKYFLKGCFLYLFSQTSRAFGIAPSSVVKKRKKEKKKVIIMMMENEMLCV